MAPAPPVSTENPALAEQWTQCLDLLRERMNAPAFETWFSPVVPETLSAEDVTLRVESGFHRDWILKNHRADLMAVLRDVLGLPEDADSPTLTLNVQPSAADPPAVAAEALPSEPEVLPERPWTPRAVRSHLNPRYVFDSFVVGSHNRFCHAAAVAVAEQPAASYNPFFVYGGVGLGKTHLMHAVGHHVLRHHPQLAVRYVTAEQFTNDLINALGSKDMKSFRDRYRKVDVLLLDDVQFLEGKERTQEEVFHTFNTLHEAGKQIILSSDRPPKHLARLEDRLRSRFEWGLIADIQQPDLETRVAILKKKIERDGLLPGREIPADALTVVAELHPNNIRELEGALKKVVAYAMLTGAEVDLAMVHHLLGTRVDPASLSLDSIIEVVAAYYHLRAADLKSPSRARDVAHARQVAVKLLRDMAEASFTRIGEVLGGRKHTSILYAYDKVNDTMGDHPVLAQQIQELKRRVEAKGA